MTERSPSTKDHLEFCTMFLEVINTGEVSESVYVEDVWRNKG